MATLICIWDAPLAKLATWSMGFFAVYKPLYLGHLRHGPPELYSYTSLCIAIQRYTTFVIFYSLVYYRMSNVITPVLSSWLFSLTAVGLSLVFPLSGLAPVFLTSFFSRTWTAPENLGDPARIASRPTTTPRAFTVQALLVRLTS